MSVLVPQWRGRALLPEERERLRELLGLGGLAWTERVGPHLLRVQGAEGGGISLAQALPRLEVEPYRGACSLGREVLGVPFPGLGEGDPVSRELDEAWGRVETHLRAVEISLVWCGPLDGGLCLYFHYVRTRCLEWGTSEALSEWAREALAGRLSLEELQHRTGTRTGLFIWNSGILVPTDGPPAGVLRAWRGMEPAFSSATSL